MHGKSDPRQLSSRFTRGYSRVVIFTPNGKYLHSFLHLKIIITDKSLGSVGHLLLQGHSRRPK